MGRVLSTRLSLSVHLFVFTFEHFFLESFFRCLRFGKFHILGKMPKSSKVSPKQGIGTFKENEVVSFVWK